MANGRDKIAFDHSKLIGLIIEKFGTRGAFAAAAGFSESQLSARLNSVVPFTDVEIKRICAQDILDIAAQDIPVYFFTLKVR